MSSSPDSVSSVDRTSTPAHEIPIRRQKRVFNADIISDVWVEAQRAALLKLKDGTRIISARTVGFVDHLLSQCNTALGETSKNEYFSEIVEGLQQSLPYLEGRLANDDQWAEDLVSFQKLAHDAILLKYGDYYAEGCNLIRSLATGEGIEQIRGQKWSDVLKNFEEENNNFKNWKENGETGAEPKRPIHDMLRGISLLWKNFDMGMLTGIMECYVERNGIAHNGLNELIKDREWDRLAIHIRKDYHAVDTYYPLPEHQEQAHLLKSVINKCQEQFYIYIADELVDGLVKVKFSQLRPEIVLENYKVQIAKERAKEDAAHAAELEKVILEKGDEEPLTEAQIAELLAAQKAYQSLISDEKQIVAMAKKQKLEEAAKEAARKEAAKEKILDAKARLEKAMGKSA